MFCLQYSNALSRRFKSRSLLHNRPKKINSPSFQCVKLLHHQTTFGNSTSQSGNPINLKDLLKSAALNDRDHGDFAPSQMVIELCSTFNNSNFEDKKSFFLYIVNELGVNHDSIKEICTEMDKLDSQQRDEKAFFLLEKKLKQALTPPYENIFSQIIAQNGGLKQLIDMRGSLLKVIRSMSSEESSDITRLKDFEQSLKRHLQYWFSVGFLQLEQVTWNHPGSILEKIKKYSDSVHPMDGWEDLKIRLSNNKRCYAYFHPSMPLDPVVFIEVELTDSISSSIEPIIRGDNATRTYVPTTAIFYAITSTQSGLAGIDLGNMLIKRVVSDLKEVIPTLDTFCTLSPIPSFKMWLDSKISLSTNPSTKDSHPFDILSDYDRKCLQKFEPSEANVALTLKHILESDWIQHQEKLHFMKDLLLRLCTMYIYKEKKHNLCFDPVANFHLRNGAQFYRINWMADPSEKRYKQSYGLMANYLYILEDVKDNNKKYLVDSEIKISDWVKETLEMYDK